MILGHITNTYMLGDLLKRLKIRLNIPVLIFGAINPDIIDKPLAAIYVISGRGIAHSFIIQSLIAYLAIRIINKKWTSVILTFWAGNILHLIQDWPDLNIIFWPLLGPWDFSAHLSVYNKFYIYYILNTGSILWGIEIISIGYIIIRTNLIKNFYNNISSSISKSGEITES